MSHIAIAKMKRLFLKPSTLLDKFSSHSTGLGICEPGLQEASGPVERRVGRLILYHTACCHLCEEAETLVKTSIAALGAGEASLILVDIADDTALQDSYGLSIPVLRDASTGEELRWPFGLEDIYLLLLADSR